MFLCHINDLPDCVKSQVRLFADDCLIYRQIKTQKDHQILQNDLKELEKWAAKWGMRFNAKKCYILSIRQKSSHFYQLDGEILQQVDSNPYLGLTISEDLQWKTHITNITKKANSSLGFLRRNLKYCSEDCKRLAYIALVRSILQYGAVVWDPYQSRDIIAVEKVQRQAARFIKFLYRQCNFLEEKLRKSICSALIQCHIAELSETQNYAYWYARFFPGTHDFR